MYSTVSGTCLQVYGITKMDYRRLSQTHIIPDVFSPRATPPPRGSSQLCQGACIANDRLGDVYLPTVPPPPPLPRYNLVWDDKHDSSNHQDPEFWRQHCPLQPALLPFENGCQQRLTGEIGTCPWKGKGRQRARG